MRSDDDPSTRPLIIDGHADTAQRFVDEHWNFENALGHGMLNLATARAGCLSAEFFAIWVDPNQYAGRFHARALELIDAVHQQIHRNATDLALCRTTTDLHQAHREGKFGICLGLEGGHAIESDLDLLRAFYRLGVRYMTLTWSHSVGWADSSGDAEDESVPHAYGLSSFGREVIHEMNHLGMMVDVSHVSDPTFWAVLETSAAPVIASHSSARALTHAPRNLTDAQLQGIRDCGGVAMVNFFPAFLDEAWRQAWNAQKADRDAAHASATHAYRTQRKPVPFAVSNAIDREFAERLPAVPFHAVIDHIEHMLAVAGPEHVGIGSDFDGIPTTPAGLRSAADLPKIAEALALRGHAPGVIKGLLGCNIMRVFKAVEDVAKQLQTMPAHTVAAN